VPPNDVAALEAALEEMLYDADAAAAARRAVQDFAEDYRWSTVLAPVVDFCRFPRRAADLEMSLRASRRKSRVEPRRSFRLREDAALAKQYLTEGGPVEVVRRAMGRLSRPKHPALDADEE
jgi:hypothetical protein